MNYKQFCKEHELLARLSVLRARLVQNKSLKEVSSSFGMGRNTVTRLCMQFRKSVPLTLQEEFLTGRQYNVEEAARYAPYLLSRSRKPTSHKRSASRQQVSFLKKEFTLYGVGWKQLYLILSRKNMLRNLTLGMIKGVYRREGWNVRKVRTKKGTSRPLYDYTKIGVFEHLHYDTKELLDLKALPKELYNRLATMKEAPRFLWNIMDAKSRFRFIAFSKTRNATFGWGFLVSVVFFLRHLGHTHHIRIGMDNGSEFCAGSATKEAQWNAQLALLDASVYSYHPKHDVRKNLIERSHGTDDTHFLLPALARCTSAEALFREGQEYVTYFNWKRPHTGIEMFGRTPAEVIRNSHIFPNHHRLQTFPILLLDHEVETLLTFADALRFFHHLQHAPTIQFKSQKQYIDFIQQYPSLQNKIPKFAPNVLDYHQSIFY